jgi:hypothetical protein
MKIRGALLVGVVLIMTACSNHQSDTFLVSGKLSLPGLFDQTGKLGAPCRGHSGYEDIAGGARVAVTNPAGDVIARSELATGQIEPGQCVFSFRVRNVPDGQGTYGIEVAHRGIVKYSRDDAGRALELTLDQ